MVERLWFFVETGEGHWEELGVATFCPNFQLFLYSLTYERVELFYDSVFVVEPSVQMQW